MLSSLTAAVILAYVATASGASDAKTTMPPQAILVDQKSFNVLGAAGSFRTNAWAPYNPTNTSSPFFQAFSPSFIADVLGPDATIHRIASRSDFAFAHEGPIYVPSRDEVFFGSNDGDPLGFSDWNRNNQVNMIRMKEVETALKGKGLKDSVNVTVTKLDLPDTVQMTNGGTGPYHGQLVLVNSGRQYLPPNIVTVNPAPPHNTTVLLDNFYGRQFNSLNDVKVHHQSGAIFFTDVTYGYLNHFRPAPLLPSQVYRFDPKTGGTRVVADGFAKPNGLAFDQSGRIAYIADTGVAQGFLGMNQTAPATIYAFDVDRKSQSFTNRRVLAYVDTGVPDGLQVDTSGNVYAGCADGVHVYNSEGDLLGKFFLGMSSANMVFAGPGRLVILAETAVYLARIKTKSIEISYP